MGSGPIGYHLRLADPPDAETVYLEDLTSSDYVNGPAHVAGYYEVFGMLAQAALDPDKSAAMIEQVSEDLL